jgi:hypothetical protein
MQGHEFLLTCHRPEHRLADVKASFNYCTSVFAKVDPSGIGASLQLELHRNLYPSWLQRFSYGLVMLQVFHRDGGILLSGAITGGHPGDYANSFILTG